MDLQVEPQSFDKSVFFGENNEGSNIPIVNDKDRQKFIKKIQKDMREHYCPKKCKLAFLIMYSHVMCDRDPLLPFLPSPLVKAKNKIIIESENMLLTEQEENLILFQQNGFRNDFANEKQIQGNVKKPMRKDIISILVSSFFF